jgi:hypothetical protein
MKAKQERMEAKIEANDEKFEVLQGTLSLLDGYPRSQDRGHARKKWMPTGKKKLRPAKGR